MKKNDLFVVVIVHPENFLRLKPLRRTPSTDCGAGERTRSGVFEPPHQSVAITCSTHVTVSLLTCEVCGTVGSEKMGCVKRAGGFRCGWSAGRRRRRRRGAPLGALGGQSSVKPGELRLSS